MLLPSIRRLALADVNTEVLRELIAHGEDLFVERKRQPPNPPRFGAGAAAFANTLGGFILLGVNDDKSLYGYEQPHGRDLQSHLAVLLRSEVDPLPPFVAETRTLDDKPIVVMRIFESVDGPHIVRGTGALYLRSSRGKDPVPVDDQRTLLELARRGRAAEEDARRRLSEQPVVGHVLWTPDWRFYEKTESRDDTEVRVVARAAPLTVPAPLRDWPLTRRAADRAMELVGELLPKAPVPLGGEDPYLEAHGRAMVARTEQVQPTGARHVATIVMDSAGVFGAELRFGNRKDEVPGLHVEGVLHMAIVPLATKLAVLLQEAEAFGRAATDLWVMLPPKTRPQGPRSPGVHVAGEITIPADEEEVLGMATGWHRELQRNFGIAKYERETG